MTLVAGFLTTSSDTFDFVVLAAVLGAALVVVLTAVLGDALAVVLAFGVLDAALVVVLAFGVFDAAFSGSAFVASAFAAFGLVV
ncbi:MAG: hypothetical protein WAO44_08940, partial [Flavobacteriaceae bacterium]